MVFQFLVSIFYFLTPNPYNLNYCKILKCSMKSNVLQGQDIFKRNLRATTNLYLPRLYSETRNYGVSGVKYRKLISDRWRPLLRSENSFAYQPTTFICVLSSKTRNFPSSCYINYIFVHQPCSYCGKVFK